MISFVIPAYNASVYLERVINSIVVDSSFNNEFEIIIVENGSTDDTTEIAKLFAAKYSNIQVLHSEKGVSNARNMGVMHANGEWIAFVDADDRLTDDALKIFLHDINNQDVDLFLYGHEKGGAFVRVTDNEHGDTYYDSQILDFRVSMLENPTRYMQVWAKLFKKELIIKNGIMFDAQLRLSEDSDFTMQYSKVCEKIYVSPQVTYRYTIDNVSTMRGNYEDKINDYVLAMNRTYEKIKEDDDRIVSAFQKYILMHLNIALVRDVFCMSNSVSFSKKIERMKEVVQEDIFLNAISFVKIQECMSFRMIPILCLKYHLYFFSGLVYALRGYMNNMRENKV